MQLQVFSASGVQTPLFIDQDGFPIPEPPPGNLKINIADFLDISFEVSKSTVRPFDSLIFSWEIKEADPAPILENFDFNIEEYKFYLMEGDDIFEGPNSGSNIPLTGTKELFITNTPRGPFSFRASELNLFLASSEQVSDTFEIKFIQDQSIDVSPYLLNGPIFEREIVGSILDEIEVDGLKFGKRTDTELDIDIFPPGATTTIINREIESDWSEYFIKIHFPLVAQFDNGARKKVSFDLFTRFKVTHTQKETFFEIELILSNFNSTKVIESLLPQILGPKLRKLEEKWTALFFNQARALANLQSDCTLRLLDVEINPSEDIDNRFVIFRFVEVD